MPEISYARNLTTFIFSLLLENVEGFISGIKTKVFFSKFDGAGQKILCNFF